MRIGVLMVYNYIIFMFAFACFEDLVSNVVENIII